jgi:M6 family metalloprotease-like protein
MKTVFVAAASLWVTLVTFIPSLSSNAASKKSPTVPTSDMPPDISAYQPLTKARTTKISRNEAVTSGQPGYLGIQVEVRRGSRLRITSVADDSPAANAGILEGDLLIAIDDEKLTDLDAFRDKLQSVTSGGTVHLKLERKGKSVSVKTRLEPTSRPLKLAAQRGVLGLRVGENKEGEGAVITSLTKTMPAEIAGLRTGDVILKVNENPLVEATDLTDALRQYGPGDHVSLLVQRRDREMTVQMRLAPEERSDEITYARTLTNLWKKSTYRMGVVLLDFPDTKHNPTITPKAWAESLFSKGTYCNKSNVTGQAVFGSLNDYYLEQSCGALQVGGSVFAEVRMKTNVASYLPGSTTASKTAFFTEAVDKLLAREGTNAISGFDALCFIYAGVKLSTVNRGSVFWPHRGSFTYRGRKWPYVICPEGGSKMNNISVYCHEFGHLLGLPDLYARPENPGSEGCGIWCAMSNQSGGGRPQHFCAWCKEQLGWLKPVTVDPTVPQKLLLSPVEGSTNECCKVLVRRDGSEYFLLENRRKTGFDQSLPAGGLIIWRVVQNRPIVEESHGVDGPAGPRVFLRSVPYPSIANQAFTPFTTPSSRSQLGGGLPVYLTNIRQLPDGRISFQIGYEYQ